VVDIALEAPEHRRPSSSRANPRRNNRRLRFYPRAPASQEAGRRARFTGPDRPVSICSFSPGWVGEAEAPAIQVPGFVNGIIAQASGLARKKWVKTGFNFHKNMGILYFLHEIFIYHG